VICSDKTKAVTILVVDDQTLLRTLTAAILRDANITVFEACNASDALHVLQTTPDIDILFSDIEMPGTMNGVALAEHVHLGWPTIKIVLTSAAICFAGQSIPGDGEFLAKPFTHDALLHAVLGTSPTVPA